MPIAKCQETETLRPYSCDRPAAAVFPVSCGQPTPIPIPTPISKAASQAPARPATADRSTTGECGSARAAERDRRPPTGAAASPARALPQPPLRPASLRPCGLRERYRSRPCPHELQHSSKCVFSGQMCISGHFCISALYYFRAARLKHDTFSEIRAGPGGPNVHLYS
jgi:hypothetical protein